MIIDKIVIADSAPNIHCIWGDIENGTITFKLYTKNNWTPFAKLGTTANFTEEEKESLINNISIQEQVSSAEDLPTSAKVGQAYIVGENPDTLDLYFCVGENEDGTPIWKSDPEIDDLTKLVDEKLEPIQEKLNTIEESVYTKEEIDNGIFPNLTAGNSKDITPEDSDSIISVTSFIQGSAGGDVSIAESASAILSYIHGNTSNINGKIYPFTATQLRAVGFNQLNKNSHYSFDGVKLDGYGRIVGSPYWKTVAIKCLKSETGQGKNNGYVVKNNTQTADMLIVGYSKELITYDTKTYTVINKTQNYNSQSYITPDTGWLLVSYPYDDEDTVCVHLAWSGYNDSIEIKKSYSESVVTFPIPENGLWSVGTVYDELDFESEQQKMIQRIGVEDDIHFLEWTEEYETVQGVEGPVEVFVGYVTSHLRSKIKKSTRNIMSDTISGITWEVRSNGDVFMKTDYQIEIPHSRMIYELDQPISTNINVTNTYNVDDFGTEWFEETDVAGVVEIKYGVRYRDSIRNMVNSGVIFSSNGIITPGVIYAPSVIQETLSANISLQYIKKFMNFVLGASVNIDLPDGGNRPFSFQMKIVQDSTGGRNLTFTKNGAATGIYNINDFDFSGGAANQRCIVTMLWDGSEYWYSVTEWFDINI